jgi:hypothetical protein
MDRVGEHELVVDFLDEFRLIGIDEGDREVLVEVGPIETVEVAPGLCQWHNTLVYERQRYRLMRLECTVVVRLRVPIERDADDPRPVLGGVLHSEAVGSGLADLATELSQDQRRRADDLAERLDRQREGEQDEWIRDDSLILERTRVAVAMVEDDVRPVEGSRREDYQPGGPIFACGAVEVELARRREERVAAETGAVALASDALDKFFEEDLSERVPEGFGERLDAAKLSYDEARWRRSMVALVLDPETPTGFAPLIDHDEKFDAGSIDAPAPRPEVGAYGPPSDVIVARPTNPVCHRIVDLVEYLEAEVEQLPGRIGALENAESPLTELQRQSLKAGRELLPRLPARLEWARQLKRWCREEYDRVVFPDPIPMPELAALSLITTGVSSRPVIVRMRWDIGAFLGLSGWYVHVESEGGERTFMVPAWVYDGYTVDAAALTDWLRTVGVFAAPLRERYPASLAVDFDPTTDIEVDEMDRANPIWIFEGVESVWPDRSDEPPPLDAMDPSVVVPPPEMIAPVKPGEDPVPGPRSPTDGGFWGRTRKWLVGAAVGGVVIGGAYLAIGSDDGGDTVTDGIAEDSIDPDVTDDAVDVALDEAGDDETLVSVVPLGDDDGGYVFFLAVYVDPSGGVSYSIYDVDGEGRDDSVDVTRAGAVEADLTPEVAAQVGENTSFPCDGATSTYMVTCQTGASAFSDGRYVIVAAEHAGPIAAGDGAYTYGLALDDDGDASDNYAAPPDFDADLFDDTEIWYRYQVDPDGTRTMWADGVREGVPGVPRHTDALVIEAGSQLIWVIPRAEVPGDSLAFRVTAFRDGSPEPGTVPDPSDSGGDILGARPDGGLFTIDGTPVVLANLDGLPPDTPTVTPRVEMRGTPDEHRTTVLLDDFRGRLDAAVAADSEAWYELIHPQLLAGPNGAACRRQIDESVGLADAVRIIGSPTGADLSSGVASYTLSAEIDYPTGTVPWGPILVPGPKGQLFLLLPSCL